MKEAARVFLLPTYMHHMRQTCSLLHTENLSVKLKTPRPTCFPSECLLFVLLFYALSFNMPHKQKLHGPDPANKTVPQSPACTSDTKALPKQTHRTVGCCNILLKTVHNSPITDRCSQQLQVTHEGPL